MKHSKIFILALVAAIAATISSCTSLENYIVKDQPDYATKVNGPMSATEYTNKINRTILPFMSEGETFLSHHLEILRGNFPINQEIVLIDGSLNHAQSAIETINGLYPPSSYLDHRSQVILRLTEYKDALKRYKTALQGGEKDNVSTAADGIKSSLASLKTSYSIYEK